MKILYLAPHLSTGGMPAFLLRRIQEMKKWTKHEIFVAEWTNYSDTYTIQKNKIKELVGLDHYICLGQLDENETVHFENRVKLVSKCYEWGIDIIHIDEIPEGFDSFNPFPLKLQEHLYHTDHPWRIVETCHNVWFKPVEMKKILPDAFALVSPEHLDKTFKDLKVTKKLITFPSTLSDDVILRDTKEILGDFGYRTEGEFHICIIGLWTPGKNQAYAIELATALYNKYGHTYQFHFIGNQALNFQDYWQPLMKLLPPNCKVWGEREDTSSFLQMCDLMLFPSTWECMPIVLAEAAALGVPTLAYNLPQYQEHWSGRIIELSSKTEQDVNSIIQSCWQRKTKTSTSSNQQFANQHEALYQLCLDQPIARQAWTAPPPAPYRIEINGQIRFVNQSQLQAEVKFWNGPTMEYQALVKPGHWASPAISYYVPWRVEIRFAGQDWQEWHLDLLDQTVNLQFGTSSLGDTLAFMEALPAFKRARGIKRIYVSTFKNWLFDWSAYKLQGIYPIQPGSSWPDAIASYELGVHMHDVGQGPAWIPTKNPRDWRKIYLGDVATDALGLKPIGDLNRPKLAFKDLGRPIAEKYIVIATQSTAQAKYWNNPTGWQELVDWHIQAGYKVFIASSESSGYMGNWYPEGAEQLPADLEKVATWIRHAEYFVGISSGLSWLAWALGAKVVLISGFTPEACEFTDKTLRIIDKTVCNSCWEWDHFDKNKWGWCPKWEGTSRQFECSKQITAQSVIEQIKQWHTLK